MALPAVTARRPGGELTRAGVAALLETNAGEIAKALPRGMTIERLAKVLLFSIDANPDLLKCTQASLLRCIKECVALGLEPGGVRGLAYLIPYKVKGADFNRECQLIVGYKGLRELAMRSGMLKQLEARVVHARDSFSVRFGLEPQLTHVPALEAPGAPVAVYCLARLADDQTHVEVMRWDEVLAIRSRSRAAESGPWVTDLEQMARKTVIRRAMNYMTLSPEVADALEAERAVEGEVTARIDVGAPRAFEPAPTRQVEAPPSPPRELPTESVQPKLVTPPATPAAPAPAQPETKPDALWIEVTALRQLIVEAPSNDALEALTPRLRALPRDDQRALSGDFRRRAGELAKAVTP